MLIARNSNNPATCIRVLVRCGWTHQVWPVLEW